MKKIKLMYGDKEYILAFTRKTVLQTEKLGLNFLKAEETPLASLLTLGYGAFLAEQPNINRELAEEIILSCENQDELFTQLAELYAYPLETLKEQSTKGNNGKNAKWEIV